MRFSNVSLVNLTLQFKEKNNDIFTQKNSFVEISKKFRSRYENNFVGLKIIMHNLNVECKKFQYSSN